MQRKYRVHTLSSVLPLMQKMVFVCQARSVQPEERNNTKTAETVGIPVKIHRFAVGLMSL